jgi:hypothetical protein
MEKISELYVILENRPKEAGELFRILKKKNIVIYAVGLFGDSARLYVSDSEKATQVLKENNYVVDEREVLRAVLSNEPGKLMELTLKMGNAGINIEYLYGSLESNQKRGTVIMEVDKPELALEIFRNHQF